MWCGGAECAGTAEKTAHFCAGAGALCAGGALLTHNGGGGGSGDGGGDGGGGSGGGLQEGCPRGWVCRMAFCAAQRRCRSASERLMSVWVERVGPQICAGGAHVRRRRRVRRIRLQKCAGDGAEVRRRRRKSAPAPAEKRRTFARTKYAFCIVFAPHGRPSSPPGPPVRPPPTVPTPRPRSPKTGRRELATPSFPRNHTTYWLPLPKMASRARIRLVLLPAETLPPPTLGETMADARIFRFWKIRAFSDRRWKGQKSGIGWGLNFWIFGDWGVV